MVGIELEQFVERFQGSNIRCRSGRGLEQIRDAARLLLGLTLARLLPLFGDDLRRDLIAQRARFDVLAIGGERAVRRGLRAGEVALRRQAARLLERRLDLLTLFRGLLGLLLFERADLARDQLVRR